MYHADIMLVERELVPALAVSMPHWAGWAPGRFAVTPMAGMNPAALPYVHLTYISQEPLSGRVVDAMRWSAHATRTAALEAGHDAETCWKHLAV